MLISILCCGPFNRAKSLITVTNRITQTEWDFKEGWTQFFQSLFLQSIVIDLKFEETDQQIEIFQV